MYIYCGINVFIALTSSRTLLSCVKGSHCNGINVGAVASSNLVFCVVFGLYTKWQRTYGAHTLRLRLGQLIYIIISIHFLQRNYKLFKKEKKHSAKLCTLLF